MKPINEANEATEANEANQNVDVSLIFLCAVCVPHHEAGLVVRHIRALVVVCVCSDPQCPMWCSSLVFSGASAQSTLNHNIRVAF